MPHRHLHLLVFVINLNPFLQLQMACLRLCPRESHWLFIVSRQILIHHAWLFICPVRLPDQITHNTQPEQICRVQHTHTHTRRACTHPRANSNYYCGFKHKYSYSYSTGIYYYMRFPVCTTFIIKTWPHACLTPSPPYALSTQPYTERSHFASVVKGWGQNSMKMWDHVI